MKQMRVYTQRITATDVVGRVLLESRANQVVQLLGYSMTLNMALGSDFKDDADRTDNEMWLQAAPRAPVAPPNIGTESLDALNKHRGNIGYLSGYFALRGPTNAGVSFIHGSVATGWIPCDFEVPGLWMVASSSTFNTSAIGTAVYHLLFDWVNRTPLQVAALYTTYGMDAVDATEREISGEINFALQPGDGAIPPIIG